MVSDARVSPLLNRLGGLYRDPNRVDRDASSLLKSSVGQHLAPTIDSLVENNGNTCQTLCLRGTISIHFRGQEYQQLLDLYLPPGYPVRPPVSYVRLANPNMYLKDNHPQVGSDGQVYLPYLHEWRPHSHTLIELVVAMSSVFSADPPVFTRTTPIAQPPPPIPTGSSITAAAASAAAVVEVMDVEEQFAIEESRREAQARQEALEAQEEEERLRLEQLAAQEEWDAKNFASTKEKVRRKMYSSLRQESTTLRTLIQQDMMDAQRLKLSKERMDTQMMELKRLKTQLTQQHEDIDEALIKIASVCKTLEEEKQKQEEEEKNASSLSSRVDDIIQPATVLDGQMLQLSANAASYTDVLYFLDKALHNHVIDLPTHLKQVRQISKELFFTKALLLKIEERKRKDASSQTISGYVWNE